MRKANNFCVFPTMFPTKIFKFKPPPHQWRLQEFYPGCSYSTLKKFRVISRRFGKYQLKFKIWQAWSLCLKKKKRVLKTKTILHFVHRKTSKGKKKMKRKEMNKGTYTINYKFIWHINKIINYCCLVVSLICLFFISYNWFFFFFFDEIKFVVLLFH